MQLCTSGNANVCLHFGEYETNTATCAVTNVPDTEQQEGKRSRCHQVRFPLRHQEYTSSQSQLKADLFTSGHHSFNRFLCTADLIMLIMVVMGSTHHFKVLCSALGAVEVAGQQHVLDVVAGAVVELPHVKGSRLEIVEVRFHFEALQNALLHQVDVPDLVPGAEKWGPISCWI